MLVKTNRAQNLTRCGPFCAGKSTLTDSLVAAAGIIAMENVSYLVNFQQRDIFAPQCNFPTVFGLSYNGKQALSDLREHYRLEIRG